MLKRLLFTSVMLLPIGAQATPMDDANSIAFAGEALKSCLKLQGTTTEYCACYSITGAKNTTLEDLYYMYNNDKFPQGYAERVIIPAKEHCTRQWWQVWK
jgi:hypothetical protein